MATDSVTLTSKKLTARFWSKVLKTDTCWIWQRQLNNKGYGCFSYRLNASGLSYNMYAHRMAWMFTHGPIPDGMNVLHRCDTPACVNPDHLFLGTQLDNMRDCHAKGRAAAMPPSPQMKLTPSQVRAIRIDQRKHHIIAADYGVKRLTVWEIKHRRTWATLD